jgi:prevent-host-death family protein
MKSIPITEARTRLGVLTNRAGYRGERILLTRNGKPLAAIVPFEDAEFMQRREDERDVREAKRVLASARKPIPYNQLRKELRLDGLSRRDIGRGGKSARKTA